MLKYRLISTFVLVPTVITTLFCLSIVKFAIIVSLICVLAAWEWSYISNFNLNYKLIWLITLCIILSILIIFLSPISHIDNVFQTVMVKLLYLSLGWWITALFLVIFYPISAKIWHKSTILHFIFGLFIIISFFNGIIMLRIWNHNEVHFNGTMLLMYILVLVWGADSGAYIFGKLLGKHKLAPKISPGKTWQGFIGGFFTVIIISYIYSILVFCIIKPSTLLICSILVNLSSVLGDLTESMFKREAGMKDSGYFVPGHGGILDCIDSLTAAVPIFNYLLLIMF